MFKNSIIASVMKPSMESSEIHTEELGNTGTATIEISRLKEENAQLKNEMEIHALESDLAVINEHIQAGDELAAASEEVTELSSSIESYIERGGMTANDAAHVQRQLKWIGKRVGGVTIQMPSTESFRGADADRITLTVSTENAVTDFFKKLWDGIKNIFNKVIDKLKEWFGMAEKKTEDANKKIDELIADYKGKEISADGFDRLKAIIGEAKYKELGKDYSAKSIVDEVNKVIETTVEFSTNVSLGTGKLHDTLNAIAVAILSGKDAASVKGTLSAAESKLTSGMKLLGGVADSDSGTTDSEKGTETWKSSPIVGGLIVVLTKTKGKEDSADQYKYSDEKEKPSEGENNSSVAEKQKIDFNSFDTKGFKDAVNGASAVASIFKKQLDAIKDDLKKDPKVPEDATDDDKKTYKKAFAAFRNQVSAITSAPVPKLLSGSIKACFDLEASIQASKKAEAEANATA